MPQCHRGNGYSSIKSDTKTGQAIPMSFDPAYGTETPSPENAEAYRSYHGKVAWLYNPWTGKHRDPRDIGSDVLGYLIDVK